MAIEAHSLEFAYAAPVLRGVSARFEAGQVSAVLGPNGCGKTTLLRLMLGLLKPHQGRCTIGGDAVTGLDQATRARRLAYVPHRPEVGYSYTVRAFVSFAQAIGPRRAQAIDAAIERLRLTDLADRPMSSLSAGQAQRASIARAVAQLNASDGGFLLADEPTAALDPRHVAEVADILRSLAADGFGVVVVLHDLATAADLADHAVLLAKDGTVYRAGASAEVLDPAHLESVFDTRFGIIEHKGRSVPMVSREPAPVQ